ncbi:MAG: PEGA domain-containing protein [Verrucomicrobiae bacterium]|nr:PEGA domain-containing protein [Verrucomicrobiae bacterium]
MKIPFPISFFLRPACLCLMGMFALAGCLKEQPPREIRLDSDPSGATLALNGKETGRTPFTLKDPNHGRYLLHLEKEGFEPLDRIVEIKSDSPSEWVLKMSKLTGLLLIESSPTGAEVTINGAYRGKTPIFCTNLPAGKHKVSFSLAGYDSREVEVAIHDRTPQLCQMNMKSNMATLKVESTPPGALVIVDGIQRGKTPCSVEDMTIGNHAIRLLKEGLKEYQSQIHVPQAGIIPVNIQLDEKTAFIDVNTTPSDAKVSLGGVFKGRSPIQLAGLKDGVHAVTIEKAGYLTTNATVEISKTQDAKLDITLEKSTGTLLLTIAPAGASIIIESELKGASTEAPFEIDLPPGNYKVEISKARHQPQNFTVQVGARKSTQRNIRLRAIWVKDTVISLKDGRLREGMITLRYPNGNIKIETAPGVFEEFTAAEIQSIDPIK